jgi:hypothetical protein
MKLLIMLRNEILGRSSNIRTVNETFGIPLEFKYPRAAIGNKKIRYGIKE